MTDPHSDPHSAASDEPETPFWLPALGFALFVIGGLGWAVSPPLESATPGPIPSAAPAVAAARPAPSASVAAPPPAPPAPPPVPSASASAGTAKGTKKLPPGAPRPPNPAKKHP